MKPAHQTQKKSTLVFAANVYGLSDTLSECPGGEIRVSDGGVAQERLPRRRRGSDPHPRAGGLQRAQIPGGRPSAIRGYCKGRFSVTSRVPEGDENHMVPSNVG